MRRTKHVKILATLGPASGEREGIQALFDAGAEVFASTSATASTRIARASPA